MKVGLTYVVVSCVVVRLTAGLYVGVGGVRVVTRTYPHLPRAHRDLRPGGPAGGGGGVGVVVGRHHGLVHWRSRLAN